MEQTWRWWGPDDMIRLDHVAQTGATGIVNALHEVPAGLVWTREAIQARKDFIEKDKTLGLRWTVVESLPVHEAIKIGDGDLAELFDNYRTSLRNLADCGISTVCYNFMPVLDWTRTDLHHPLPGGANALRFNADQYAAFDVFMLKREGAEADHDPEVLARATAWFEKSSQADRDQLLANIMAGLPGAFDRYDIPSLRAILARFAHVSEERLRENLGRFLAEIIPTAEEVGIRMGIHPDDPPRPLLGLPRIVSSEDHLAAILDLHPSRANGLTFCTGSLGARPGNDLPKMVERFADRIHFIHLRNVTKFPDGSFMEADHLGGDTNMVAVVRALLREQKRRCDAGMDDWRIPFRPDHGHELLDDVGKPTHPGYPAIGRMRGLAEIRGVMMAVSELEGLPV
ncbi:mannonate dehydratase [Flaviflagellibacter deserti]|uniref:Mannonate dehydratase n=1 Tax=Flaviflagellibacter deserti TaxID=2267266 RepID=A0ABV9Z2B9_9HYPH